ncbi:lysophospholipid acyltransferase family protein [Thalassiella azotivora]
MFYWVLKRIVLGPLLRALFRPWVVGGEHVPSEGGAILASNHLSFSDSFFLPLMVERKMTFLAKSDYFTGRGIKGRLTAGFFRGAGQVPVDRSGGEAGEAAIRTGLRVLAAGDLLGIYPEGTRSPDGRLYRGKTGVARLALEGKVPVLPVVMVGTREVQPIGRRIPRIRRVGMIIGPPMDFSRYEGMEGDRFVLRSITDEIVYELMRLSGQEYVDEYAATMKERMAAALRQRTSGTGPAGDAAGEGASAPGGRVAPPAASVGHPAAASEDPPVDVVDGTAAEVQPDAVDDALDVEPDVGDPGVADGRRAG